MAATTSQINLIKTLRRERELPAAWADRVDARLAAADIEFEEARTVIIPRLKEFPVKASHQEAFDARKRYPKVEDGYYAVREDGELCFLKVNTPTRGSWAGFTFVDRQSSDDMYAIKDKARKRRILEAIASDPVNASRAYGALGICSFCRRSLTDKDSRYNGYGETCAANHDLPYVRGAADEIDLGTLAPEVKAVEAPAARTQAQIKTEREQALARVRRTETVPAGSIADNAMALLAKDGVKGVQVGNTAYVRPDDSAPASSYEALLKLREGFKR
jgi:hypothetical protein